MAGESILRSCGSARKPCKLWSFNKARYTRLRMHFSTVISWNLLPHRNGRLKLRSFKSQLGHVGRYIGALICYGKSALWLFLEQYNARNCTEMWKIYSKGVVIKDEALRWSNKGSATWMLGWHFQDPCRPLDRSQTGGIRKFIMI